MSTRRRGAMVTLLGLVLLGAGCGDDATDPASTTAEVEQPETTVEGAEPESTTETTDSEPESGSATSGCSAIDEPTVERIFEYDFSDASQPDDRPGWEACGYAAVGSAAVAVQRLETGGETMLGQAADVAGDAEPVSAGDEAFATTTYDDVLQANTVTVFAREGDVFVQVVVTIFGAPGSELDPAVLDGAVEVAELAL